MNVQIDSRKVKEGDIFVCIKGNTVDGHDYVDEAIKNGAKFIVSEKDLYLPASIVRMVVPDSLKWLHAYLIKKYSYDINKLNIIGITGTNGKTTSAYLTYQLLNKLGVVTSYIGTIGYYKPDSSFTELPNTTPNIVSLYELLLDSINNKCNSVVMEVSSQGLCMNRTDGLIFDIGLFTNLTQDHLDYHKTMDNYLEAKLKLLDQLNGPMIVNADDKYSKVWEEKWDKIFSFGNTGDIQIIDYKDTDFGCNITIKYLGFEYNFNTKLKGKINVYNVISAISIALKYGASMNYILNFVDQLEPPRGRCEIIKCNGGLVVIDYAHTPDALLKIIDNFKENTFGKLITIFGCGGNRDAKKRPIMGQIASDLSDFVVITDDNPRFENSDLIVEDIIKGISKDNYEVIHDRKEAILRTIDNMNEGDIVLVLGKGHEDYQIIGNEKLPFNDSLIVKEYINQKNKIFKKIHK